MTTDLFPKTKFHHTQNYGALLPSTVPAGGGGGQQPLYLKVSLE